MDTVYLSVTTIEGVGERFGLFFFFLNNALVNEKTYEMGARHGC